jgi:hypothetical protein
VKQIDEMGKNRATRRQQSIAAARRPHEAISLLKNAIVAFFNLAKLAAELFAARKTAT